MVINSSITLTKINHSFEIQFNSTLHQIRTLFLSWLLQTTTVNLISFCDSFDHKRMRFPSESQVIFISHFLK